MNAGRSNPGCFRYGCLIALVLFSLVVGGIALWARKSLRDAVIEYTSEEAPPLDEDLVPAEVVRLAQAKYNQLVTAANTGTATSLTLSEQELRGLVQASSLKGRVAISLTPGGVSARFSLPLALLGDWVAASVIVKNIASRSIVGAAQGSLAVSEGVISLTLGDLTLNGTPLGEMARGHASDWIKGAIEAALVGDSAKEKESEGGILKRIRMLRIADGTVTLEVLPRSQ